jgi:dTDP-4-amino-4,6-dideoxygalactose transaminase
LDTWQMYRNGLQHLADKGLVELPYIPDHCTHNAHMFYLKVKNIEERTRLIAYLKAHEICAVFHYVPLHTAPAGQKYGRFHGEDRFTTKESERLLRLPLYYKIGAEKTQYIIDSVNNFFG